MVTVYVMIKDTVSSIGFGGIQYSIVISSPPHLTQGYIEKSLKTICCYYGQISNFKEKMVVVFNFFLPSLFKGIKSKETVQVDSKVFSFKQF